ncbi:MAG: FAD-binding and (Fe-S)-binding domain-containing protein [Ilumatobacter sp.]
MDVADFALRLTERGFRGEVEHDAAAPVVYGTDNSVYQLRPLGAVVPVDVDDLATVARTNHELGRPFSLVARGGGTGTNAQSLTDGLVVDTRRAMDRIVSIDPDARTAVVQPGVVLARLNHVLGEHGLFFAPHVSTGSRATIGGMVATDAAGKGSLVHGRTNRHVESVEAVLADGTRFSARALGPDELDRATSGSGRLSDLHRSVADALRGLDPAAFPELARGFTGYNLTGAIGEPPDVGIDLSKLVAGSEGTLALIGEITVRLEPVPSDPRLAIVVFGRFADAISVAGRLVATEPIAIECLDERTLSLATTSPAFERLERLLADAASFDAADDRAALLLLEYDGPRGIERLRQVIDQEPSVRAVADTADPADVAAVWKVRADAVGLLAQAVEGRRSVAFVEDCAVPPHRLAEFVVEFREILDRHGLGYGMFGHADVGCLHVRPALDLSLPAHETLLRTISDEVHDLVVRFGGVLWGEHGRGVRGEYLDLDDDTIDRMRRIKSAFDPHDVLNPGKLYRPAAVDAPLLKIDEVPLRVHRDRTVNASQRVEFSTAFSCNGNGICHHWGDAEVMCPSFKVTSDPRLSPKGRADLVRAWTADPDDVALGEAVADSMRQCLSCGACTGRCPVSVDIPEMKSRFLDAHRDRDRRRRVRYAALTRFEALLPIARVAGAPGRTAQRLAAPLLRRLLGVVDLPSIRPASQVEACLVEPEAATVIVVPDAFTAYLEPEVLDATVRVLVAMGESVALAPFVPSGKLDHVAGRRRRFAVAVAKRRRMLETLARRGVPLVVVEPAVSLLETHEYPAIDPSYPVDLVTPLADFITANADRLPRAPHSASTAQLFGHCTESSLAPERTAAYRTMLTAAGLDIVVESTSCCGMAGVFGHELEHQAMSSDLFDLGWRPRLAEGEHAHRCASGFSCRSQAERFGFTITHPVQVLAATLDPA